MKRNKEELASKGISIISFNENLSIPTMEKEEEKIEDVKNTSDFSKTYFLDDDIKVEQTSLDVGGLESGARILDLNLTGSNPKLMSLQK